MQDKTRVGAIIRAGMDNKEMTRSLGINYGVVSTLVFLFGAALAGFAGILGTPILGAYPSMGDALVLLTLMVVVVGGTGFIQGTMLGALIIGLLDTFGKAYVPSVRPVHVLRDLHRRAAGPSERPHRKEGLLMATRPVDLLLGRLTRKAVAAPPVAAEGSRALALFKAWLPAIVILLLLLVLPNFVPSYIQSLVTKMMIFALFGVSMNILWGYGGIPTFGHAAFFGFGGYVCGILIIHGGIANFWVNLLLVMVFTALLGAGLGVPAFRVYGVGASDNPIYFLLVTLAFGELLVRVAISARSLTGGSTGLSGIPYPDLGIPGVSINSASYYFLVLGIVAVCLLRDLPDRQLALRVRAPGDPRQRAPHAGAGLQHLALQVHVVHHRRHVRRGRGLPVRLLRGHHGPQQHGHGDDGHRLPHRHPGQRIRCTSARSSAPSSSSGSSTWRACTCRNAGRSSWPPSSWWSSC